MKKIFFRVVFLFSLLSFSVQSKAEPSVNLNTCITSFTDVIYIEYEEIDGQLFKITYYSDGSIDVQSVTTTEHWYCSLFLTVSIGSVITAVKWKMYAAAFFNVAAYFHVFYTGKNLYTENSLFYVCLRYVCVMPAICLRYACDIVLVEY